MPFFFESRGIKLKKEFRQERKDQRKLQSEYIPSSYLPPVVAELCCELTYKDGEFFLPDGSKPNGRYMFVRSLEGKIFAAKEKEVDHHSYLSNGKKVLSAGYLSFENGKLTKISNESGHYRPTNEEMLPEIEFFYNISQNEELIYEDHSRFPKYQEIDLHVAKQIIPTQKVDHFSRIRILRDEKSNFGKELAPIAEVNVAKANELQGSEAGNQPSLGIEEAAEKPPQDTSYFVQHIKSSQEEYIAPSEKPNIYQGSKSSRYRSDQFFFCTEADSEGEHENQEEQFTAPFSKPLGESF